VPVRWQIRFGAQYLVHTTEDFSVKLIVKTFECVRDLFDYPMPSSSLGICVLSALSEDLITYNKSDILYKCMCLPIEEEQHVGIPLLHLI